MLLANPPTLSMARQTRGPHRDNRAVASPEVVSVVGLTRRAMCDWTGRGVCYASRQPGPQRPGHSNRTQINLIGDLSGRIHKVSVQSRDRAIRSGRFIGHGYGRLLEVVMFTRRGGNGARNN
jgi:hypothetical protein